MPDAAPAQAPITIKKYANRRLYNTATSSYVTLENLCLMVKEGVDFVVFDAKTGDDITRAVLTQIIVEEESKGQNLLPISFLRQLISLYGDSMQWVVPSYLENSMKSFARNQDQMRSYLNEAFGGLFPFSSFEQIGKQNMAMIERAMKLFTPTSETHQPTRADAPAAAVSLEDLKAQLAQLQRQIDALTPPPAKG